LGEKLGSSAQAPEPAAEPQARKARNRRHLHRRRRRGDIGV